MAIYNLPTITIKNTDNMVYRDTPYELQFKIEPPTLVEDIIENVKSSEFTPLETKDEYKYGHNKTEWISISSFGITDDKMLQITGKKILKYTYKVFFNDTLIKDETTPTSDISEGKVTIYSSQFNNFVDGNITIKVFYGYNEEETWLKSYDLHLVNTQPVVIIGDVVNNKFDFMVNDVEGDEIQLNIKLNNKDYFPTNGGFTDFISTPYFYTTFFNSDELNINPKDFETPNNIVTITVKDKYGAETQLHKSFVGQFYGLMFVDKDDDFYSTDSGDYAEDKNILKELYLGNIKAGTRGDKKCVYLYNMARETLTNIELTLDTKNIPKMTDVRIGTSALDNFEDMDTTINFEKKILKPNERLAFYIQGSTEILSEGGGYGYIDVIADATEQTLENTNNENIV